MQGVVRDEGADRERRQGDTGERGGVIGSRQIEQSGIVGSQGGEIIGVRSSRGEVEVGKRVWKGIGWGLSSSDVIIEEICFANQILYFFITSELINCNLAICRSLATKHAKHPINTPITIPTIRTTARTSESTNIATGPPDPTPCVAFCGLVIDIAIWRFLLNSMSIW